MRDIEEILNQSKVNVSIGQDAIYKIISIHFVESILFAFPVTHLWLK